MKHQASFSFLLLSTILLFVSCDKFKGDAGPAGPNLSGDIIGYVYLYDLSGNRATDNSGVSVSAEGSNATSTTGSDGRFVLSSLTTGIYTISFVKSGYGTRKYPGSQFVGGGQVYWGTTSMYQLPTFTVTNLVATTYTGYILVTGTLSGALPTGSRYQRLFISTSSNVSSDPSKYTFTYSTGVSSGSTTMSASIYTSSFNSFGIYTGQTVYIIAYADAWGSSSYIDLSTGKQVYTSIGTIPSNTVSAVVP